MTPRAPLLYLAVATVGLVAGFVTYGARQRPQEFEPAPGAVGAPARGLDGPGLAEPQAQDRRPASDVDIAAMVAPLNPRYDAIFASAYLNLSPLEVFERESRVAAFADRREQFLPRAYGPLLEELIPTATVPDVECRTRCCLVHVRAPNGEWSKAVQYHLAWGDLASVKSHVFADGGEGYEITACSSPATSVHEYFETVTATRLARVAPDLRALRDAALAATGEDAAAPER